MRLAFIAVPSEPKTGPSSSGPRNRLADMGEGWREWEEGRDRGAIMILRTNDRSLFAYIYTSSRKQDES